MKKVIIDASHGINTKGKSSPDCALMEWRYNREIANAIAQGLILRGYDAEVIVARARGHPSEGARGPSQPDCLQVRHIRILAPFHPRQCCR